MSKSTKADPSELRASAGACDDIARTMKGPADKAIKEAGTAGSSLRGWSMGSALTEIATSWKPALDGLHARVQAGGDNLRSSANGHEWNDQRVSQDFEKAEADTATQATPGVMPPALRPAGGESHRVGSLGGQQAGDAPLDPRASYGTNMPTYDETIGIRPTPGTNDFG
ncbi:hypothetical protein ACFZBP_23730 [Streptomyces sp. NPDC008086]|uniref:hypothetical protein n=1 Tax=Streptomyces sp. NPDC008086 TaxID=3364807 RepID=UPI0036ED8A56